MGHAFRTAASCRWCEFVAVWPQELVARLLPGGFAAAACGIGPAVASSHGSTVALGAPGCDCGCRGDGLADAAGIRRRRATAASAALGLRVTCGADVQDEGSVPGAQTTATKADALLLRSLARLRGPPRRITRIRRTSIKRHNLEEEDQ